MPFTKTNPQGCCAPRGGFGLDRWFVVWRGLGKRI